MRKRRLRGGITALSVLAAIGMASGITAFAADDTQSEAVDTERDWSMYMSRQALHHQVSRSTAIR